MLIVDANANANIDADEKEDLVKGVHHEQGDVEEDNCWVTFE